MWKLAYGIALDINRLEPCQLGKCLRKLLQPVVRELQGVQGNSFVLGTCELQELRGQSQQALMAQALSTKIKLSCELSLEKTPEISQDAACAFIDDLLWR